jgi:uncharacterized protein
MGDLTSETDLRSVYKTPSDGAISKDIGQIDKHFADFIALSSFLYIGTSGPSGMGDVSPRGGEPGFVHVLDRTTLAMPDRPGNNRLDSLTNITRHPGVGLLFFVPGFEDVLRVNGFARVTTHAGLVARFVVDGKPPRSVIVITVKEAYLHCPKAIKRARLWNPDTQIDRARFPSAGQIYRDQLALEAPADAIDAVLDQDVRENLY